MSATLTAPRLVSCAQCGVRFPRTSRRPPKYCPDCRPGAKRARDASRNAAARADVATKQAVLREILEPLRDVLADGLVRRAEDYIASIGPSDDGIVPIVRDQQPARTASPSGSDDGVSTNYADLSAELERRQSEAASHDWHLDHPWWWAVEDKSDVRITHV